MEIGEFPLNDKSIWIGFIPVCQDVVAVDMENGLGHIELVGDLPFYDAFNEGVDLIFG